MNIFILVYFCGLLSCIEGLSCGSHGTNFSTPCFKDETKCSKPTFVSYLCHGTLLHLCDKSDNEKVQQKVCSSIDPKPFQCPEFWEACQQVPGARYHNNECIDSFNAFPNNFDCINRMDVAERLFTLPLAFGEIDRTRTHFRQDNLVYGYNQSGFNSRSRYKIAGPSRSILSLISVLCLMSIHNVRVLQKCIGFDPTQLHS